ncbi:MAG: glycosyltransferase [Anaerolineales bacterium]|nr:glycosyltransferase [Anaerolineales bacterium]
MKTPLVSVVMPVYNGLPYLREAIDSIFAQTLGDLEFICIDDGSTDGSAEVLAGVQDPRWRLVRNRRRAGLSVTLNRGLRMARGVYWARMDSDDISLPARLEKQVAFLESHPDISLVSAWAQTMGLPKEQIWKLPTTPEAAKADLLFNSPFVHGAVMLRRKDFVSKGLRYNPRVERAQDYELWERAARRLQMANVPEVLLRYRIHAGQVGQRHAIGQAQTADAVRARQLKRLGIAATRRDLQLHSAISTWQFEHNTSFLRRTEAWLRSIERANKRKKLYAPAALRAAQEERWWAACRAAAVHNRDAWRLYSSSPLARGAKRSVADKAVFWMKTQWPR